MSWLLKKLNEKIFKTHIHTHVHTHSCPNTFTGVTARRYMGTELDMPDMSTSAETQTLWGGSNRTGAADGCMVPEKLSHFREKAVTKTTCVR